MRACVCVCMCVPLVSSMQCTCALLSPVACPGLQYFPHYPINSTIKKIIEYEMCVLTFPTTYVWNISHCKKNLVTYNHKCTLVSMLSTHHSCQILMTLEFSRQFSKATNIKFHENPSSGCRHCSMRTNDKTGRHQEANSRFSQFCYRALKVQINVSALHDVDAVSPSVLIKQCETYGGGLHIFHVLP